MDECLAPAPLEGREERDNVNCVPFKEKVAFCFAALMRDMSYAITGFLTMFYLDIMGFANTAAILVIPVITRVWDGGRRFYGSCGKDNRLCAQRSRTKRKHDERAVLHSADCYNNYGGMRRYSACLLRNSPQETDRDNRRAARKEKTFAVTDGRRGTGKRRGVRLC